MRNASKLAIIATLVASISQPVHAFDLMGFFGFGDKEEDKQEEPAATTTSSIAAMAKQMLANQSEDQGILNAALNNPILETITNNLDVSSTQAATGTAALLGMAAQKLGAAGTSELGELMPQMSQLTSLLPESLSSKLDSITQVKSLFEGLGMDPSMISQFVPIIISGLTNLGASAGLVNQLNSIWNTM